MEEDKEIQKLGTNKTIPHEPMEEVKSGLYKINETTYLKVKTGLFKEPSIIFPIRHPITNKPIWSNLIGSKTKLLWVVIVFILLMGLVWTYNHDIGQCKTLMKDPCYYCQQCYEINGKWICNNMTKINLTQAWSGTS